MRKKILIKPHLQLRHLLWTLGVVLLASVTGYLIMETILKSSLVPQSVSVDQWLEIQQGMRAGFAILLVIVTIGIGLENYFLFHRVVGPLYALEKGLKRLAEGHLDDVVRIRDNDDLKDLIASFEEMKALLRQRIGTYEKTAQMLNDELSSVLTDASLKNITRVRERLKLLRGQSEKKAA